LSCVLLAVPLVYAQDMEIQAELMGPLSTQSSQKGDRIFARVTSPDALKGDMLEGKVTAVRSGGKMNGKSVLNFSFETLQHANQAVPLSSEIKAVSNSKGQVDVDEEGRIVRKSNNLAKTAGAAAAGGLFGGIIGGGRGAAIGAGAGALAAVVLIEVAAQGPSIRFDPGSRVTISAKSRSGLALSQLAPNAPAAAPASAPAVAAAAPASAPAPNATPAAPAAGGSAQPDLVSLKSDFIPGEKTVFFDDFTDMLPDEAPPHFKVRGAAVHLKQGPGFRQATITERTEMTPALKNIPKNFTAEIDTFFGASNCGAANWFFYPKGATGQSSEEVLYVSYQTWDNRLRLIVKAGLYPKHESLIDDAFKVDFSQPVKMGIWVQDGRVRVYANGEKLTDANQVELPELEWSRLDTGVRNGCHIGHRRVRVAESMPDFSRVITSSGRYVTHGIQFDTDSDRLKPESASIIKMVARGLLANPNLKLLIEGHTDSTGNAERNLDLSKRRAEAVKTVLVSQFSIEADRLTTDGLGASKPIDSNDTPQGRAQNRRVEFARQ
jgi:outer membrane protein OmpA-like peptidoglycan-associated protein